MSRKPKAIRLSKAEDDEVDTKSKVKSARTKATKQKQTSKTVFSDRSPRVLPAPKLDDTSYDPFDQKPFTKDEDQPIVHTHLPDMSKGMKWGSLLFLATVSLLSIGFTLWLVELIESFFARNPVLGWVSLGLGVVFGVALLALVLREFISIRKLRKLSNLRQDAEQVLLGNAKAQPVINRLYSLYADRVDMHWHLEQLESHRDEIMDDEDRIIIAEKTLLAPLDAEAKQIIASSAKRISVVTALNPSAVLDVLFVGYQILQMLRKLMALYGGRPAFFAAIKLVRMVATHLAVTGGLAVSDTILQQVLGKGLAGTLSRKVGEGTVNGIMATRIGIAALDLCRPLPFKANDRPSLKGFIAELVGGKLGQTTQ